MKTAIKRLYIIIIMALVVLTGFAQDQPQTGDVIYVYQKDGNILPFLRSEIIEFYYGFEDENGVTQDEPVMQWIVLEDSICKIPLANIDSVSFVTPATVYQPGVIRIEQGLMEYVLSSDSLTFTVDKSVPGNLLPKTGDKLVTTDMNEKFPMGFVGEVSVVSDAGSIYTIVCDAVNLEDIFDTYYHVTAPKPQTSSARKAGVWDLVDALDLDIDEHGKLAIMLPAAVIDWGTDLEDVIKVGDYAFKGDRTFKFTLQPSFEVKAALIVNPKVGTKFNASITADLDALTEMGLYGHLEWAKDKRLPDIRIATLPIPYFPFINVYANFGGYVKSTADVTASANHHLHYQSIGTYSFDSRAAEQTKPTNSIKMTENKFTTNEFGLNGTVGVGGYFEIGLSLLISNIGRACLRGEVGIELASDFVIAGKDVKEAEKSTALYDRLKETTVDCNFVYGTSADAIFMDKYGGSHPAPLGGKKRIATWNLVPEFSGVEFEQCYSPRTSADAYAEASADPNCLMLLNTGFRVVDSNGTTIQDWMDTETMGGLKAIISASGESHDLEHKFEGLEDETDYKLYPKIRLGQIEMLASPSVDLDKDPFPVRIVSFKQTGSHYSKQQGYEYDGRNYFYKFNATTTVELSEGVDNVKDWGYIYHDIYGIDKKISCANLGGRTYPDERYAYYYNDPQRTVELYPYVQFEGETESQAGKHKIFSVEYKHGFTLSCPDENHPHAIDLGLPSGTLWACCNVGAETPEDFGKYYRWGEVKEVDGSEYPEYLKDLPTANIAGTTYDVAVVNWGGGWNMPSVAQFNELDSNSSIERIYLEETGGLRFIGTNGNSIFLPAAGAFESNGRDYYKKPTEIDSSSSNQTSYTHNGLYWMQTGIWGDADDYQFDYSYIFYHDDNRLYKWYFPKTAHIHRTTNASYAMPVRPVLKNKE